ncbi:hypothetical protein McanMca71_000930 [Microsporum canis]
MWLLTLILDYGAPPLLVLSPVLSYSDQIMSIHRKKTSAGFSLDIPLIMLVASIFKIFYWFGAYYSVPLLVQAISMIAVQVILLKVALDNRPSSGIEHTPFNGQGSESGFVRPYRFWQWKTARPYWTFLVYFTLSLLAIHILLPPVSNSHAYIELLGFSGLGIEAFLPIPQIISNQRSRSCEGFRPSVLVSWLLGDAMKMSFFFFSDSSFDGKTPHCSGKHSISGGDPAHSSLSNTLGSGKHAAVIARLQLPATGMPDLKRLQPNPIKQLIIAVPTAMQQIIATGE